MKKVLLITAAVAVVLIVLGVLLWMHLQLQKPEVLLDRLRRGSGDKEELVMRLNVARGDSVGPMLTAFQDESAPTSFRADILELLFKRNLRSAEPRIEKVILKAIKNPDPIIRRRAAYGLAIYSENRLRLTLADSIDDPDPEVRRQVYLLLTTHSWRMRESQIWDLLSKEQKATVTQASLKQMKTEETPEMRFLPTSSGRKNYFTRPWNSTRKTARRRYASLASTSTAAIKKKRSRWPGNTAD